MIIFTIVYKSYQCINHGIISKFGNAHYMYIKSSAKSFHRAGVSLNIHSFIQNHSICFGSDHVCLLLLFVLFLFVCCCFILFLLLFVVAVDAMHLQQLSRTRARWKM